MGTNALLVLRFSALGDLALLVPVLRALERDHPERTVYLVTRPAWQSLFASLPNVIPVSAELEGRHRGFSGLWRLFRELRQLGPDAVIDMHDVFRTRLLRLLFRLAGIATYRINKPRAARRAFLRSGEPPAGLPHVTEMYLTALRRAVPVNALPDAPPIIATTKAGASLQPVINPGIPTSEKYLVVAPFSRHKAKEWPLGHMAELLGRLAADGRHDLFCLAFGERERGLAARLARKVPQLKLVPDTLDLGNQLLLLAGADAVVSMDSANMHLAVLTGAPVVSIWGPTHPDMGYAPLGNESYMVQASREQAPWRPLSVYGRLNGVRQHRLARRSMELVSVDAVFGAVQRALAERNR